MKALLLRIGIDKGTDGALAPIFDDLSFEYIPLSERDTDSSETKTYKNYIGRSGKTLATFLPKRVHNRFIHFDPEFESFTYGDPTSKRKFLLKLIENDLLVFYAGLAPFQTNSQREGLYIIGYFTVNTIIDFQQLNSLERQEITKLYPSNAHIKRSYEVDDLVIIIGKKEKSRLLDTAILISQPRKNSIGRYYHAVSTKMEELLGISGSIQRSIPPRFIPKKKNIENLRILLNLK